MQKKLNNQRGLLVKNIHDFKYFCWLDINNTIFGGLDRIDQKIELFTVDGLD